MTAYPLSRNYWGILDLLGNGWEWTSTPFAPFPGYEAFITTYPGYSADFFDGKHFVLRGGSWATVEEELRPTFRNWYQGRYPYVFSKFRPVRPVAATLVSKRSAILRLQEAASPSQLLAEFASHVMEGMARQQPVLSSMYFYDDVGSKIYEEITHLKDEYYLTATEHAILHQCKGELATILHSEVGNVFNLVELGCGDGHKTDTLIRHFEALAFDLTYYPVGCPIFFFFFFFSHQLIYYLFLFLKRLTLARVLLFRF